MFEKFSNFDIDASGSGGEYTVQAGFGWTNGALLWVASTYGHVLDAPKCPNVTTTVSSQNSSGGGTNGALASGVGAGLVPFILTVVAGGMML